MQYGRALDRPIREVVIADLALLHVYVLMSDISDGFYRIGLKTTDVPNLGLVLPSDRIKEDMVAIPLILPMTWKNSPPIFCTATDTVAYLSNAEPWCSQPYRKRKLDNRAEA